MEVPYNLPWKLKKSRALFGVMKNLIWTQVHFNITLPKVKSERAHTFVVKHIQTHTATASPADGGNQQIKNKTEAQYACLLYSEDL